MKAMKMDELTKQIALEAIALERESVKMYRDQAAKIEQVILKMEKDLGIETTPAAAPVVEQRELLPMFKVIDREIYDSYFVRLMQLRRSYPECSDADLLMYELCRTFQLRKDEQAQRTDGEGQQ